MPGQVGQIQQSGQHQHQQHQTVQLPLPGRDGGIEQAGQGQEQGQLAHVHVGAAGQHLPVEGDAEGQLGGQPVEHQAHLVVHHEALGRKIPQGQGGQGDQRRRPAQRRPAFFREQAPEKAQAQQPGQQDQGRQGGQHQPVVVLQRPAGEQMAQHVQGRRVAVLPDVAQEGDLHAAAQTLESGQEQHGGEPRRQQGAGTEQAHPLPGQVPEGGQVPAQQVHKVQRREDAQHEGGVEAGDDGQAQTDQIQQPFSLPQQPLQAQNHQGQEQHRVQPHDAPAVAEVIAAQGVGGGAQQDQGAAQLPPAQEQGHGQAAQPQLPYDQQIQGQGQLLPGEQQHQQLQGAGQVIGEQAEHRAAQHLLGAVEKIRAPEEQILIEGVVGQK